MGRNDPSDFFTRNPKSKIDFKIVMPRQKQNNKLKKIFSRHTPPILEVLSE